MTDVQVYTYGDLIVHRKLTRLAEQAEDLSDCWDDVVKVVARGYENAYNKEGPGWPELKLKTILNRIAAGQPPGPIRTASGKDRKAMTDPDQLDYIGGAHDLNILGTEIAEMHQFGWTQGNRVVPARPLKLTRYFKDQISKVIQDQLLDAYNYG